MKKIIDSFKNPDSHNQIFFRKKTVRIVVIVPLAYRGGSLRGAKLLAQAIEYGSKKTNEDVEVIFAHLDDPSCYTENEFIDLPISIKRRPYKWRFLSQEEASRAMVYAGSEKPMLESMYQVPDDGINQFLDCSLWVIVSDRLDYPLLPIRPYVMIVYDYLQRYISLFPSEINRKFITVARQAKCVIVTTEFTKQDAIQFAGVSSNKIFKLPMLAPDFSKSIEKRVSIGKSSYFLWTTNTAIHKNHYNAFKALQIYYEDLNGKLKCYITGVGTKKLLTDELTHLARLKDIFDTSKVLNRYLKVCGELTDREYKVVLAGAHFLWHAAQIDNGTFSVIEAAHLRVPSLSSDYPAMREIDTQFSLNLTWMKMDNPVEMAKQLKYMEDTALDLRDHLPNTHVLAEQAVEQLSKYYWDVIGGCL